MGEGSYGRPAGGGGDEPCVATGSSARAVYGFRGGAPPRQIKVQEPRVDLWLVAEARKLGSLFCE